MRHVVFLQQMPSGFARRVGRRLTEAGCRTTGIVFCAGDVLVWSRGRLPTAHYRGRYEEWPVWFETFLTTNEVTDIVLLGEQRRYHREAVAIAKRRGVAVVATDFGYLRPDWITLERDGMNGSSRFPKDAAEIARIAAASPAVDLVVRYRDSDASMSFADLTYLLANVAFSRLYPNYRHTDNRPHPIRYLWASTWRGLGRMAGRRRHGQALRRFLDGGRRYILFPLQIEHDFQIVSYSPFGDLSEAITQVIASFAANASPETVLLVKPHPWDPGFRDWERLIAGWAADHGVTGRIVYVEGGDLDLMIRRALGVVTVNSTTGLHALRLGKPVITLGQAIYDMPGLTAQAGVDSFWRNPVAPDPALVEDFIRAIAGAIQVRGVFFREPGLTAAVEGAAARIRDGTVGIPPASGPGLQAPEDGGPVWRAPGGSV